MNWNASITDQPHVDRILADHHTDLTRLEDTAWHEHGKHRFGVSYQQGYRRARRDVLAWVLDRLTRGFDDLTGAGVIDELRKGADSIYWPLFIDDNKVSLHCDHCRTHQLFDNRGVCDSCGREMD